MSSAHSSIASIRPPAESFVHAAFLYTVVIPDFLYSSIAPFGYRPLLVAFNGHGVAGTKKTISFATFFEVWSEINSFISILSILLYNESPANSAMPWVEEAKKKHG